MLEPYEPEENKLETKELKSAVTLFTEEEIENRAKTEHDLLKITRMRIMNETVQLFKLNGFEHYRQHAHNNLIQIQKALSNNPDKKKQPKIVVTREDSLAAAFRLLQMTGKIPVVLNMANQKYPGGGYKTGAAAQEENLCRRSNIHFTFTNEVIKLNGQYTDQYQEAIAGRTDLDGKTNRVFIDMKNPRVCIRGPELPLTTLEERKKGQVKGYQPLLNHEVFLFTELRSAAINLKSVTLSKKKVKKEIERRIEAQLDTLIEHDCKHVVLSAFGCGAFDNPPEIVAEIYKKALENRIQYFDQVIFAVYYPGYGPDNYSVFKRILQPYSLSKTDSVAYLKFDDLKDAKEFLNIYGKNILILKTIDQKTGKALVLTNPDSNRIPGCHIIRIPKGKSDTSDYVEFQRLHPNLGLPDWDDLADETTKFEQSKKESRNPFAKISLFFEERSAKKLEKRKEKEENEKVIENWQNPGFGDVQKSKVGGSNNDDSSSPSTQKETVNSEKKRTSSGTPRIKDKVSNTSGDGPEESENSSEKDEFAKWFIEFDAKKKPEKNEEDGGNKTPDSINKSLI